jgi:hypothetical protein
MRQLLGCDKAPGRVCPTIELCSGYRPDTRLPAAQVAGRTETDQPVGRVARALILTAFPLVKPAAGRPPYAMRPD